MTSPPPPPGDPTRPAPRTVEYEWMSVAEWHRRHQSNLAALTERRPRLLLAGDSITEGWQNTAVWRREFLPRGAVNFGVGGDNTQNLLWRLATIPTSVPAPHLVMLLIGTNNLGREQHSPEATHAGVAAIVATIAGRWCGAKILLHAILPFEPAATAPVRARIAATNRLLRDLAAARRADFVDLGGELVEPNGDLHPACFPDGLHPSAAAYERWAAHLLPVIDRLLEQP